MKRFDLTAAGTAATCSPCIFAILVFLLIFTLESVPASGASVFPFPGSSSEALSAAAFSPDSLTIRLEGEREGIVLRWIAPPLFSCLTYTVERAWTTSFSTTAALQWKEVGTVPGICNVSEYIPYSFVDTLSTDITTGRIRYRLSGETLGGWEFEFYSEDHLLALPDRIELVDLYPLPASQVLTVSLAVQQPRASILQLFSSAGRRVMRMDFPLESGVSTRTIELGSLPAGAYILEVRSDADVLRKMVQVMR